MAYAELASWQEVPLENCAFRELVSTTSVGHLVGFCLAFSLKAQMFNFLRESLSPRSHRSRAPLASFRTP